MKTLIYSSLLLCLALISSTASACGGGGDEGANDCPPLNGSTGGSLSRTSPTIGTRPTSNASNPISIITGNKYQFEADYKTTGDSASLFFNRHYNSLQTENDTGIGIGWRHSFDITLLGDKDHLEVTQSDGRRIVFKPDSTNTTLYRAAYPHDGVITSLGKNKMLWALNDGRSIIFKGTLPIEIIHPGQRSFKLGYKNKKLNRVVDHTGKVMELHYSAGNTALASFNQNNNEANLAGHLQSVTLPDGGIVYYSYDSDHNLSKVTYPNSTSRTYHYEDIGFPNHLTGITDRTGIRFSTWGYTDEGRANLSEHIGGVGKVTLEYFIPEQVGDIGTTVLTNSLGQKSTYKWRNYEIYAQPLLISSEGPGCSICPVTDRTFTYDNQYQLLSAKNTKTGLTTRYSYDKQGRTKKVINITANGKEQLVTRYEYDGNLPRPTLTARPSINPKSEHITRTTYNDDMLPIIISESGFSPTEQGFTAIERTTKLTYTNGNVVTIDGPRKNVQDLIQLTYDAQNRLRSITQAESESMQILAYDSNGRPVEIRKGQQSPFNITYDSNGKVKEVKQRTNSILYDYDKEGRLTSINTEIDGDKHQAMSVSYDAAGRLDTLNNNQNQKIQQIYDTENNLKQRTTSSRTDSVISTISYLYDAQGRLDKTQTQDLDGENETDYQYDSKDQLTKISKSKEQSTELSYNNLGQLISLTQPGDVVTQFNYDPKGQNTALTDAKDNKTQTIKDDFGRVVKHINPDTGTNIYAYDNAGNRIKRTDPEGNITSYQWNATNKLAKKESTTALGDIEITTYQYDSQTGKLASTTNPNTTESFKYNTEAQLIHHTRKIDGHSFTTEYEYNDQGSLYKKHLPDGQTIRYHYYTDNTVQQTGRLRAITRESIFGLRQENIVAEIDSNESDGKSGYLSHNGILTQYKFRDDGQLSDIQIANTLRLQYSYDQNGDIIGIDEDGTLQNYAYDQGRLTLANTLAGQYQYRYDKVGNRTQKTHIDKQGNTTTEAYQYPEKGQGNRLTSLSRQSNNEASNTKNYLYNKNGSPDTNNDLSYEYNADQRPIKVYKTTDGQKQLIAEYQYNSFGERIKKVVYNNGANPKVTYYLYDGHTLTAEATGTGEIASQYIYLKNQPIAKLEKKTLFAIHSDNLGTPRIVTNDKQETVWKANYTPFGKAKLETQKTTLNLRFPGQYKDQETGTHYNYLRDYDPKTGRYITSDPIGLKGGINTYAYVDANPLGSSDILGLLANDGRVRVNQTDTSPAGEEKPVVDASFMEKTDFVIKKMGSYLVEIGQTALANFFTVGNIATMVGITAGIAALQLVPGLNGVVNIALLGWTWWNFGSSAVTLVKAIISSAVHIYQATTRSALCAASRSLATALANVAANLPPVKLRKLLNSSSTRVNAHARENNVNPNNPTRNTGNPSHNIRNGELPLSPGPGRRSYTFDGNNVRGPQGGLYTRSPFQPPPIDGRIYRAYSNNGKYYVFQNGRKTRIKNPNPGARDRHVTGLIGEIRTTQVLGARGYQTVGRNTVGADGTVRGDLGGYMGRQGIDGIYKKDGKYIIVETKSSTGTSPGGLQTSNDGAQLSKTWTNNRVDALERSGALSRREAGEIKRAIRNNEVTYVKADVTNVRNSTNGESGGQSQSPNANDGAVSFRVVEQSGEEGIFIGDVWNP